MQPARYAYWSLQLARRGAILALLHQVQQSEFAVTAESCPVRHFFADGAYGREITMPAGLVVIGKIHKHSHVNTISKGAVKVFTEQDGLLELRAPVTFVSHPYTQRVVFVLEDTVWTTVHVTDKTDLAEIEDEVIAKDFDWSTA